MAVRIIEMSLKTVGGGFVNLIPTPFNIVQQAMTPTTNGTQRSGAFAGGTNVVRVEADEDVHVNFGVEPTATTDHPKIYAGGSADFIVSPGHKMAVRTA